MFFMKCFLIHAKKLFSFSLPVLSASGKLDKKALPSIHSKQRIPDTHAPSDERSSPATEIERYLESVWCEVLQLEFVDVQESFFELGG